MEIELGTRAIAGYLESAFASGTVRQGVESEDHIRLRVERGEECYYLKIEKKFILTREGERLVSDMDEFAVIDVLGQLHGMTVLLSESGCVFDPYD